MQIVLCELTHSLEQYLVCFVFQLCSPYKFSVLSVSVRILSVCIKSEQHTWDFLFAVVTIAILF